MSLFVTRFKELLNQINKLQKDVCVDLGISKQKLSNWKTGYTEPNLDDIMMLASYFRVSTDYLLGLEDEFGNKTFRFKPKAPKMVDISIAARDGTGEVRHITMTKEKADKLLAALETTPDDELPV